MQQAAIIPDPAPGHCFHCGLPIPEGGLISAPLGGVSQAFCCRGCQAVAMAIVERGLGDYYRWREAPSAAPAVSEASGDAYAIYDDALVQARFVREGTDGRHALLLVEGLRCSACAWLVEQALAGMPGVVRISVNYANHRASLAWDPALTRLSVLLKAVAEVGYQAAPYDPARIGLVHEKERRSALWRLFVAGFGMMQVMMYAVPAYLAGDGSMSADVQQLMRWAGLILTLPVLLYAAAPFFRGAWRDLRRQRPGMDVPVALGIAVAFFASAWSTLAGQGEVYFDSVAMFVFLLLAGRYLELLARQKAAAPLEHLARVVPETANRLRGPSGSGGLASDSVPVAALQAGERLLVRPGEIIPADGVLEGAAAQVAEALITGESRPLHKAAGDGLIGGSLNAGDALVMRVTRVGSETMLSAIIGLVDRAMAERPPLASLAQRAATWFVVAVLFIAVIAGLAWLYVDASRALWVAVSVLIVTCPCALSLATPAALTVATGAMAGLGLVPTRGHTVEALAEASDFVFDKTGTLTQGRMQLLETLPLGRCSQAHCIQLAATLERASEHPIAAAFLRAAPAGMEGGAGIGRMEAVVNARGWGVEALLEGRRHRIGRADYVARLHGQPAPLAWLRSPHSIVWLGDESGWLAAFQVGDGLRAGAAAAVAELRAMGRQVHLLSGDEPGIAADTARALGIEHATGHATPELKLAYVRELQRQGAKVAMLGDGINDAPVLAQADVSVAMAGGSDLAQVRADAVLLSGSLGPLVEAVKLARRTRAIVRQNLAWALAYNLIAIPLAVAGLVTPLLAGIGMSASSLLVVLNAQRLRKAAR